RPRTVRTPPRHPRRPHHAAPLPYPRRPRIMIDAATDNIKDPLATTIIQAPHTSKRERIRRVLLAVIAAAAFVTALYQALDAARELLAERDTVKAIAETTRARLDAEREKVAEL